MSRKKTVEARVVDLINEFGLTAVVQCVRVIEAMERPRRQRRSRKALEEASAVLSVNLGEQLELVNTKPEED